MAEAAQRSQWGSRFGFVLAAAGSAVGLGNLWKFPYVTGENGGGAFVLVYLLCITLVGLPILLAEVLLGRMAAQSPVGAFRALSEPRSPWVGFGWLSVVAGFVILSYYSVVAGWGLHYVYLSLRGTFSGGVPSEQVEGLFDALYGNSSLNLVWHGVFMAMTITIVLGGVQRGVERAAKILMPALFLMMLAMFAWASTLEGFGQAVDFVLGFHAEKLTPAGVLEALGHSFFTLSVGMGAMLTYGSYLSTRDDVVATSFAIGVLDTIVALLACLVLFPITFTRGMQPAAGPGLVFKNMPVAFSSLPGGTLWASVFFLLLSFAALTSAISLLEVCSAYFIDERGWTRRRAVLGVGLAVAVVGVPSALSGGSELFGPGVRSLVGRNWFDSLDYLASNWMLPLGGLGIGLFLSWRVGGRARQQALAAGSEIGAYRGFYLAWLSLLRYVVPVGIAVAMLNALGLWAGD